MIKNYDAICPTACDQSFTLTDQLWADTQRAVFYGQRLVKAEVAAADELGVLSTATAEYSYDESD